MRGGLRGRRFGTHFSLVCSKFSLACSKFSLVGTFHYHQEVRFFCLQVALPAHAAPTYNFVFVNFLFFDLFVFKYCSTRCEGTPVFLFFLKKKKKFPLKSLQSRPITCFSLNPEP